MSVSERIQELRKNNKESQEQLADKLEVSRQAISKWESGQGVPDVNNIIKLGEIYNVTTDYILRGIEPTPQPEKQRKIMDTILKKALMIVLVVVGIALATALFIFLLTLIGMFIRNVWHINFFSILGL